MDVCQGREQPCNEVQTLPLQVWAPGSDVSMQVTLAAEFSKENLARLAHRQRQVLLVGAALCARRALRTFIMLFASLATEDTAQPRNVRVALRHKQKLHFVVYLGRILRAVKHHNLYDKPFGFPWPHHASVPLQARLEDRDAPTTAKGRSAQSVLVTKIGAHCAQLAESEQVLAQGRLTPINAKQPNGMGSVRCGALGERGLLHSHGNYPIRDVTARSGMSNLGKLHRHAQCWGSIGRDDEASRAELREAARGHRPVRLAKLRRRGRGDEGQHA
mmetsp:Transcript_55530/g.153722  ORF Transcript_55530/g.153722 Transcript_55530/m.153722 type:complete len:274 (+) Transcript_55530:896-1717(+)